MDQINNPHEKPRRIVMVGAFPPPTHGMAAVNAAVCDRLIAAGAGVFVLDVAAPSLDRGLSHRLGRLPKVLQGLVRLVLRRAVGGTPLYMSVSGGLGQVYELFFLIIARIKDMPVVLHHHSFAYLDRSSRLTRALVRFAGERAQHVVLSQGMGRRLKARYTAVGEVIVMTNAALLLDGGGRAPYTPVRKTLGTIGFLSNLSAEKGVFEFLDVCMAAQSAGLPLQATLAGPFQDAETERRVHAHLQELTNVEYVGPQYGEAKTRFYRGIDVLLFPTRYRNEAEPLVVLEAMREGLPVVTYGRGAIAEYVDDSCGHVVPVGGNFVEESLRVLRKWRKEPELLQETSKNASQRFIDVLSDGIVSWKILEKTLRRGGEG